MADYTLTVPVERRPKEHAVVTITTEDGKTFVHWLSANIKLSMENISRVATIPVALIPGHPPEIGRQDKVTVKVGDTQLMSGIVLATGPFYRFDDAGWKVTVRDLTGDLIKASALHKGGQWRNVKIDVIITDLIKVLGCGVEVEKGRGKELSNFDLENLRWNKVIICTDADVDGYQIRTLILTMLYRLVPTLIKEGKVFIAESPLYEITCKDETWFCYTEKEKQDALLEIGDRKYTIQRSKGLGENEPEMMWLTTMNPKTRRLIKVEPDYSPEAVADKFDLLLGDNLQGRKDYIAENGAQYIDMTDLS